MTPDEIIEALREHTLVTPSWFAPALHAALVAAEAGDWDTRANRVMDAEEAGEGRFGDVLGSILRLSEEQEALKDERAWREERGQA